MGLKPARIACLGTAAIFLFISLTIAQDIGHLGVDSDPIPLVQAKRPLRRLAFRGSNRNSNLATVKPDPLAGASKDLRADVSEIGGATGKSPKTNSNTAAVASTTVAVTANPATAGANPEIPPEPKSAAKSTAPSAETFIARAEELSAKNDPIGATEVFKMALA